MFLLFATGLMQLSKMTVLEFYRAAQNKETITLPFNFSVFLTASRVLHPATLNTTAHTVSFHYRVTYSLSFPDMTQLKN